MAIEGLRTAPQPNAVNMQDEVDASVEALEMLGLVQDRDRLTETVAADFNALAQSGQTGEAFIQLPRGVITLEGLIAVSDGATYAGDRKYPATYKWGELWTPGAHPDGFRADDLDNLSLGKQNGDYPSHARLAVHNPASEQEPLLHFLGKPFDGKYAEPGQQTQLEAVDEAAQVYVAEYQDFVMTPLNAKAVAMIALTRRIKGETMPMAWGFMLDATLPRKSVDGDSVVGYVNSAGDQLRLNRSNGRARSGVGVGLSMGPKVLELQVS